MQSNPRNPSSEEDHGETVSVEDPHRQPHAASRNTDAKLRLRSATSEGAVKPPVFLTSTFVFRTAEDGQDFFDFVSGRREPPEGMGAGLVYSRSIIPTARSSRTGSLSTSAPRNARCSRPACLLFRPRSSPSSVLATLFYTLNHSTAGRKPCLRRRLQVSRSAQWVLPTVLTKPQLGWRRRTPCAKAGFR